MTEIWTIGGTSVVGSAHVRRNMPNQDAMALLPDHGSGSRVVLSVSDGHGSSPHFRSGSGARLAVTAAAKVLAWHLDAVDDDEAADGSLAGEISAFWQRSIDEHIGRHPFDEDQQPLPGASPYIPYGATLLAMGVDAHTAHLLQIGDGDMMIGYGDGRIERPLRADEGLVGEETYSLCQSDAETHFRVATLWRDNDIDWPDFILLASDGVSKSFSDPQGFVDAVRQLRALAHDDFGDMLAALPGWLTEISANGSGDDSTLCIAVRKDNGNEQNGKG